MPRTKHKSEGFKLSDIVPGSWKGELIGGASINFGQVVQPGEPRQAVEFSYCITAVALAMPDGKFRWPGVLMLIAPTPMKTAKTDAGILLRAHKLPSLSLSLDVTREQFSDMLRHIEASRLKHFHFTVEDAGNDGRWPIHSWGMTVEIDK